MLRIESRTSPLGARNWTQTERIEWVDANATASRRATIIIERRRGGRVLRNADALSRRTSPSTADRRPEFVV
jgi:hypothetical protein